MQQKLNSDKFTHFLSQNRFLFVYINVILLVFLSKIVTMHVKQFDRTIYIHELDV